jgi:hypothetical protein
MCFPLRKTNFFNGLMDRSTQFQLFITTFLPTYIHKSMCIICFNVRTDQGCRINHRTWYPEQMYQMNTDWTKLPYNIPNVCKIFQMPIKYINIYQSKALQNLPKFGIFGLKRNRLATLEQFPKRKIKYSLGCISLVSAIWGASTYLHGSMWVRIRRRWANNAAEISDNVSADW